MTVNIVESSASGYSKNDGNVLIVPKITRIPISIPVKNCSPDNIASKTLHVQYCMYNIACTILHVQRCMYNSACTTLHIHLYNIACTTLHAQ